MEERRALAETAETKRCPYCFELIHADAVKCHHCRSSLETPKPPRQWHRRHPGRKLLGVSSCIAFNYGVPVTLVRLGFVLLSLFHGLGILLYLALWAVIPASEDEKAKLGRLVGAARRSFEAVRNVLREEFPSARTDPPSGGSPLASEPAQATETR